MIVMESVRVFAPVSMPTNSQFPETQAQIITVEEKIAVGALSSTGNHGIPGHKNIYFTEFFHSKVCLYGNQ